MKEYLKVLQESPQMIDVLSNASEIWGHSDDKRNVRLVVSKTPL